MHPRYHQSGDRNADYSAAKTYAQQCAKYILEFALPIDVDVLNINVPAEASPMTPWRLTKASRERYFIPTTPDRSAGSTRPGYRSMQSLNHIQRDTDIWTVQVDHLISITPLSLDLTARTHFDHLESELSTGLNMSDALVNTIGNLDLSDEEKLVREQILHSL
jgi:5'-nucleotidase